MFKQLNRAWRLTATLAAAGIFFAGTIPFQILVLPLYLLPASKRQFIVRLAISQILSLLLVCLRMLRLFSVVIHGRVPQPPPGMPAHGTVIVANHPTYFDILVLLAIFPQSDIIYKNALRRDFFLGPILRAAGYLSNDESVALIDTCIFRLLNGGSLIVFPEGTRSENAMLGRFKRGAAAIALRSRASLLPVVLHCSPPSAGRGQNWLSLADRAFTIDVRFGEPLSSELESDTTSEEAGEKLTDRLQRYFEVHLPCV